MQGKTGFQKCPKMVNFDNMAKIFVLLGVWKKKKKQNAEKSLL